MPIQYIYQLRRNAHRLSRFCIAGAGRTAQNRTCRQSPIISRTPQTTGLPGQFSCLFWTDMRRQRALSIKSPGREKNAVCIYSFPALGQIIVSHGGRRAVFQNARVKLARRHPHHLRGTNEKDRKSPARQGKHRQNDRKDPETRGSPSLWTTWNH